MFETRKDMATEGSIYEVIYRVRTFAVVSAEQEIVEGKLSNPEQIGVEERRISSEKLIVRVSPEKRVAGEENTIVY